MYLGGGWVAVLHSGTDLGGEFGILESKLLQFNVFLLLIHRVKFQTVAYGTWH